jgi:hypothetical protein
LNVLNADLCHLISLTFFSQSRPLTPLLSSLFPPPVLSTENLGRHTRRAAGILVMGVAGGAAFPPIQGAIADTRTTRVSMWLAFPAFLYVAGFSLWCWINKGRKFTRAAEQAWLADRAAARAVDFVPALGGAGVEAASSLGEDEKKIAQNEEVHVENVSYNRV